jgi:hypothetical protein
MEIAPHEENSPGTYFGRTYAVWDDFGRKIGRVVMLAAGGVSLFKGVAMAILFWHFHFRRSLSSPPDLRVTMELWCLILLDLLAGTLLLLFARRVSDFIYNRWKPSSEKWAAMSQKHP